jgi:hypothetical protein
LLFPWLLQSFSLLSGRRTNKKLNGRGILISLLVLMGGYFLRRTMIEAGHASSKDARTTLWNAQKPQSVKKQAGYRISLRNLLR